MLAAMTVTGELTSLRPAREDDLDLLTRWFGEPEVYRWWGGSPLPREAVAAKYVGRRRPRVESYVIEAHGTPVGYIQYHYGFEPYHGPSRAASTCSSHPPHGAAVSAVMRRGH